MADGINMSSTITLNDGVIMPLFGLGTYMLSSGSGQAAETITEFALQNGYRLLDTAAFYRNERDVGVGVKKSGLPRSDVFIVTKLWQDSHGYENCKAAFLDSLKKLDCGYVDLYLIHSPLGGDILRTYDAMIELKNQGLIRYIVPWCDHLFSKELLPNITVVRKKSVGVSNFGVEHLEGLRKAGRPAPSVNQIELHPLMRKPEVVNYCNEHGIVVMGYSPLAKGKKMDDTGLNEIAARYGKSLAQLMIRWSVQKGYITIPKSSLKERVIENTKVFDWSIKDEDVKLMVGFVGIVSSVWLYVGPNNFKLGQSVVTLLDPVTKFLFV